VRRCRWAFKGAAYAGRGGREEAGRLARMPGPYEIIARSTLTDLAAAKREAESCRDEAGLRALRLAERSAAAANAGDVDTARREIAEAVAAAGARPDVRLLFLAFQFFFRTGDLNEAERLVRRRIELSEPNSTQAARAHGNLGLVLHTRGDFDSAAESFERAIAIDRFLGDEYGLARDLGNSAMVPESRGDLEQAEQFYLESLAIAERIGAEDIAATKLANLGDVALRQGRPERAREVWVRAVELLERSGKIQFRDEYVKRLEALENHG
jgi:tetratricopeptide (TPR) repeat protein